MTSRPRFDEGFDSENGAIVFVAWRDGARIRCEVSEEVLWDHYGPKSQDPRRIFSANRPSIEAIAASKIESSSPKVPDVVRISLSDFRPGQTGHPIISEPIRFFAAGYKSPAQTGSLGCFICNAKEKWEGLNLTELKQKLALHYVENCPPAKERELIRGFLSVDGEATDAMFNRKLGALGILQSGAE